MNEAELRIQHLNFEKERLKKRYLQSVREINDHIKNCERSLSTPHNKNI